MLGTPNLWAAGWIHWAIDAPQFAPIIVWDTFWQRNLFSHWDSNWVGSCCFCTKAFDTPLTNTWTVLVVMEHFSRRRWTTGSLSWTVHEYNIFFILAVCASVLKLIFHRANTTAHLLQFKCPYHGNGQLSNIIYLNGPFLASFSSFCLFQTLDSKQMFIINFVDDCIWTSDLWFEWPLYQLSHNRRPQQYYFKLEILL